MDPTEEALYWFIPLLDQVQNLRNNLGIHPQIKNEGGSSLMDMMVIERGFCSNYQEQCESLACSGCLKPIFF